MIVIYETYAVGKTHVPFNAGLIRTVAFAYPGKAVRFYADPSHIAEMKAYMAKDLPPHFECREIAAPGRALSYRAYAFAIWKSLNFIAGDTPPGCLLTLSCIIPESLMAVKIFLRSNAHFCGGQAVLHGQLSEIVGWRTRNPLARLLDFKSALSLINTPRLRYITLEPSIGQELARLMPALAPLIDILPHPLPDEKGRSTAPKAGPLTIGYLGLVTEQKGFPIFRDVAEAVKQHFGGNVISDKVRFLAIGHTQGKPLPKNIGWLDVKPQTGYLARDEFERLITACHFICLPYTGDIYRLVASGVLLDALAFRKPLIAFKTPATSLLFEEFGDLGYLCETPGQVENTIIRLSENPDWTRYRQQCLNMARAAASRKPETLAGAYAKITDGLWRLPQPGGR